MRTARRLPTVTTPTLPRRIVALAAGLLACAGLVACQSTSATSSSSSSSSPVTAGPAAVPDGLEDFYGQDMDWQACDGDDSFECAQVEVPLDYADPDGTTIKLALKKLPASDGDPIGTLFINPGGPGGSGIDLVGNVEGYFSKDLLASFDVVGFDPRGVGSSTAVDCLTDAELDADRAGEEDAAVEDDTAAVVTDIQDLEAKCEANTATAGLLDHIDTISAARDLDVMRALVGDDVLYYLGYSYGTYLGATYADLFPANVGRLVLDGAVDPSLSAAELTQGQAEGFEAALRAYVENCQAGSQCPLSGGTDNGVKQIQDFLQSLESAPLPTSDANRPLTYSLGESAIIGVLYQDEAWSVLDQALDLAMNENDGSTLLAISDLFASRNDDGTYDGNGDEVITAINCLDYPVEGDQVLWDEQAVQLEEASPTFGEDLAYSDLACQAWGHESTRERAEIHASGAAPILVVGTTGDPATPYKWAQSLADQLDDASLVTWEGNGHTAYGRAGSCVTTAVDNYLLSGTMPEDGLTCTGQN